MIAGTIAFLVGVLILYQLPVLPGIGWSGLLLPAGLLLLRVRFPFTLFLFSLVGFCWALLRAHWVMAVGLPASLQGEDIEVTGVVASIPVVDKLKTRFEFEVESYHYYENTQNSPEVKLGRVRLSWYTKKPLAIKAGQRWQFTVRLKQPHGFMNPGGFDYEAWLFAHKIRATGYIRTNKSLIDKPKLIDTQLNSYAIQGYRQAAYDSMQGILSAMPQRAVIQALTIGERSTMTPAQWEIFRATGTSHLVAISGMHIGFLAGLVFFIVRWVWAFIPGAALGIASPKAAAIAALLAGVCYAALSGFAIPAQRALIMLSVIMLAIVLQRPIQTGRLLPLALLIVLIHDPSAVLSAGLWLSFFAVLVILLIATSRKEQASRYWLWSRLQWRISVLLIPVLLYLFQHASLVSPLANLVAIPVVSLLIVPACLLGFVFMAFSPDLAALLFTLADGGLDWLWWLLDALARFPYSQWSLAVTSLPILLFACLGMILLLAPRGWPAKSLGLIFILPVFSPQQVPIAQGNAEFTLLDVGQGLAAIVRTRYHTLVFDAGARFSDRFDAGEAVVVPYLRTYGIRNIDRLIVSHADNDHHGGVASVRKNMEVGSILSSFDLEGSEPCQQGQQWVWDGVVFEILHPGQQQWQKVTRRKRNDLSCVLRVSTSQQSVLLTADIESKAEVSLLASLAGKLASDVLVVPHHGSKSSSSRAFIEAVSPKIALFPVGYRNRYRLPHADVAARYQQAGTNILSTASSGAIEFRLANDASQIKPREYRKVARRFWHHHE